MTTISQDNDAIAEEILINAPPERVFQALTDPKQLVAWWGDPTQYWCTSWTLDLRVGGKWRSEGQSVRGGTFAVEGEFLEIDPPKVLSFSWRPSWVQAKTTKVRIVLEARDRGTLVRWTHSGFAGNRKALEEHLHGLPSVIKWLRAFVEHGENARPVARE